MPTTTTNTETQTKDHEMPNTQQLEELPPLEVVTIDDDDQADPIEYGDSSPAPEDVIAATLAPTGHPIEAILWAAMDLALEAHTSDQARTAKADLWARALKKGTTLKFPVSGIELQPAGKRRYVPHTLVTVTPIDYTPAKKDAPQMPTPLGRLWLRCPEPMRTHSPTWSEIVAKADMNELAEYLARPFAIACHVGVWTDAEAFENQSESGLVRSVLVQFDANAVLDTDTTVDAVEQETTTTSLRTYEVPFAPGRLPSIAHTFVGVRHAPHSDLNKIRDALADQFQATWSGQATAPEKVADLAALGRIKM